MIKVRLPIPEDKDDLFKWRNDKHSIEMFLNSETVTLEDHQKWFSEILSSNINKHLFICLNQKNEKIGVVRFDIKNTNAEISINIAPEMRGKSLGKHCLIETFIFAKKHIPDVEVLTATIKNINKASQKVFESAGFNFVSEVDSYLIYNKKFNSPFEL
tara:strand:- start:52 stop:525 length:474 start_codon:yes stop_codon:yes gene_type:complete